MSHLPCAVRNSAQYLIPEGSAKTPVLIHSDAYSTTRLGFLEKWSIEAEGTWKPLLRVLDVVLGEPWVPPLLL